MEYRKKPVVIDADIWDPKNPNARALANMHGWRIGGDGEVYIGTLEGTMQCLPGDWLIRGVQGEYYPCKPDIFALTYEKVEHETVKPQDVLTAIAVGADLARLASDVELIDDTEPTEDQTEEKSEE